MFIDAYDLNGRVYIYVGPFSGYQNMVTTMRKKVLQHHRTEHKLHLQFPPKVLNRSLLGVFPYIIARS